MKNNEKPEVNSKDTSNVTKSSKSHIKNILRNLKRIINMAGCVMLFKIIKGSKDKKC